MSGKIRYVSTNGKPAVQIIFDEPTPTIRVQNGWKNKVKFINQTTYQVPPSISYEFVECNKEKLGNFFSLGVEDDTLPCYYGFYNPYSEKWHYSTNITPKFAKRFYEQGEKLVRFEANIGLKHTNCLGMVMPEFESVLFEYNCISDNTIGDFTENELKGFIDGVGEDTEIVQDIKKKFSNVRFSKDALNEIKSEVEEYENKLQSIFDEEEAEIEEFRQTLPQYGLDCGFTTVYTQDNQMNEKYRVLIDNGIRSTNAVNVRIHDDYSNCSHSHNILHFVQKKREEPELKDLFVRTILD